MRQDKEEDVYKRLFSIRPADCCELLFGKGFKWMQFFWTIAWMNYFATLAFTFTKLEPGADTERGALAQLFMSSLSFALWMSYILGFECCPCCILDETITDLLITSHRVIVEQRMNQRYCRQLFFWLRPVPNVRVTFIANHSATAYIMERNPKRYCINQERTDFLMRIMPIDFREFPSGLVLRQQPYTFRRRGDPTPPDHLWVENLQRMMDLITRKDDLKEIEASSSEDEATDERKTAKADEDAYEKALKKRGL
jgi:hypothetical protein